VQRDSWKIQRDLEKIQEDLPNRGIMRTYKDSRGDLKEIQKDSELEMQRNLRKIAENPGEIQVDYGKILNRRYREIYLRY
jgi:hypothetical protein